MGWVPEGAGEGTGGRRRRSSSFPTKMTGAALRRDLQGCYQCCWCCERSMTKRKPMASWKPAEPSTLTRGLAEALPQAKLTQ
jgi:hypothetical protein